MATYVYETVPSKPGQRSRRFEVQQGMMEAPLKTDPETGLPVRRVITGGLEIPRKSSTSHAAEHGGGCCGGSCGCH
jgi:hypothetical protein